MFPKKDINSVTSPSLERRAKGNCRHEKSAFKMAITSWSKISS